MKKQKQEFTPAQWAKNFLPRSEFMKTKFAEIEVYGN